MIRLLLREAIVRYRRSDIKKAGSKAGWIKTRRGGEYLTADSYLFQWEFYCCPCRAILCTEYVYGVHSLTQYSYRVLCTDYTQGKNTHRVYSIGCIWCFCLRCHPRSPLQIPPLSFLYDSVHTPCLSVRESLVVPLLQTNMQPYRSIAFLKKNEQLVLSPTLNTEYTENEDSVH